MNHPTSSRLSKAWQRARVCVAAAVMALVLTPKLHAQTLPVGCQPLAPETCEYQPANHALRVQDFLFRDPARLLHAVPFRVRYPALVPGPRPVVIWSHGGGPSEWVSTPLNGPWVSVGQLGSVRRSESFARAGYVVIHIGRMPATSIGPLEKRDCIKAGWIDPAQGQVRNLLHCRAAIGQHVYGPLNVAYVVDLLRTGQVVLPPNFIGTLDTTRIVVGGWSAGTQSVMNIAGAYQQFGELRVDPVPVPGVVAFFADAPRRPEWSCRLDSGLGDSGFQVDSFQGIDGRPFLFNSGVGDIGPDRCASAARTNAWQEAARPNKLLSWSNRLEVNHGTVDLSDDGCAGPINTQLCRWLESLGVAYLDAAVRSRPAAQDWLDSDVMRVMTLNRIELHRR